MPAKRAKKAGAEKSAPEPSSLYRVPDVNDLILKKPPPVHHDDIAKWITELEEIASAYPFFTPGKPGFDELVAARNMARRAADALSDCTKSAEATWAGMRAVYSLFMAMLIQGRPLMDAGIPNFRATEQRNLQARRVAASRQEEFQRLAAEKWAQPQHAGKSKSGIARLIAPNDPKLQRKIREAITKPAK